ncbi:transglutaminase domain-containing protein [candidate division WOR-3 bacterium]|nr:transglutaminase domain-containing protein [candidate division WOR-3 bacterium]
MCSECFDFVRTRLFILVLLFSASSVAYGQAMTGKNEMEDSNPDIVNYYRQPGVMTEPGEYSHLLGDLPKGIPDLCKTVQGVILHIFWSEAYGVKLSEERKKEVNLRKVERMLARIVELDKQPINVARDPEMRVVGNCRDYSVLLCALLRHNGMAARARCGFATYFTRDKYEDHWICEYWNGEEKRWVRVDAQLDSLQVAYLKIDFNPHDLPAGKFLSGGEAWQLCRSGELDPDLCGIFDMKGLWFVQGDLVRDFMALNKLEVLPWDCNEFMGGSDVEVSPEDYQLLDKIAELITNGNAAFSETRLLYESNERLRMPSDWRP